MKNLNLILIEQQLTDNLIYDTIIQKTVIVWLSKELHHSTDDACAELSAQAFKINSCQTAAHKV